MKFKQLIIAGSFVIIAACSNNNNQTVDESSATLTTSTESGISEGERLIAQTDCGGCHSKDQKIIGPAYVDIAAKYESSDDNVNNLSAKVILGGKGVWGEVPMTPHPSLTESDAKEMVRYILSVKK